MGGGGRALRVGVGGVTSEWGWLYSRGVGERRVGLWGRCAAESGPGNKVQRDWVGTTLHWSEHGTLENGRVGEL